METVATLCRMTREQLSDLLLSQNASKIAVVDVRDDDHVGGHIHGSTHVPSSSLDHRIPETVRVLADKEVVVFHCALSQQRGPSAALRYVRERENKIKRGELAMPNKASEENDGDKATLQASPIAKDQEVYVLDKGFVGWQEKYGADKRLTDAYAPDIWADY